MGLYETVGFCLLGLRDLCFGLPVEAQVLGLGF